MVFQEKKAFNSRHNDQMCQMPNFSRYPSLSYSRSLQMNHWLGSHITKEGVVLSQNLLLHNLGKWGEESRGPQSQCAHCPSSAGSLPMPKQEHHLQEDPWLQRHLLLKCKRYPNPRFASLSQFHCTSATLVRKGNAWLIYRCRQSRYEGGGTWRHQGFLFLV